MYFLHLYLAEIWRNNFCQNILYFTEALLFFISSVVVSSVQRSQLHSLFIIQSVLCWYSCWLAAWRSRTLCDWLVSYTNQHLNFLRLNVFAVQLWRSIYCTSIEVGPFLWGVVVGYFFLPNVNINIGFGIMKQNHLIRLKTPKLYPSYVEHLRVANLVRKVHNLNQ